MKDLADVHFPEAEVLRVVVDNLNTHDESSLYETFTPALGADVSASDTVEVVIAVYKIFLPLVVK
jgi:hypothetical protein